MKLKFFSTMQIICAYYRGDRSLKRMICMIYVHPEKTEFLYFLGYVSHTLLLYALVLPDGV
jgi:hypothetical protein